MGKPSAEASSPTSITHFSHPHPLQLLNPQTFPQTFHCSACKLAASAAVYACINCNFSLHPKCSQLPQQINHPFDQKHALVLYPKPVYPEGLFNCDACGNRGGGFSFHCSPCGIDLHTTCASLPINLTHHCHHDPLTLTFSAPYPGNTFSCDICKKLGSKTWIYRCATCEFDVHLTCVATIIPPPTAPPTQQLPYMNTPRSFVPTQPPLNPINPPNVGPYGGGQVVANTYPAGVPQAAYGNVNQPVYRPVNGLRDQMTVAAAEGIASGVAQSATQALIQGLFGGGGAGAGDVVGMDGGGVATIDECSYYDGGYGGTDGGFSGGDGSY